MAAQLKQANYFSHQCGELEPGERIEEKDLKRFKNRTEHKEYRALVENGGVKAARAMMRHRLPTAVELHFTNMIKADAAGDYNAVARFTNPLIDRVEPRMGPNMLQTNTAIQVTLTVDQAHSLSDDTPEAECEVISEAVFTAKD